MPTKKHIRPDEKLPLKLTAAERKLVLNGLTRLDPELKQIVRDAPAGQPVKMTLDELHDFGGYVAAEAKTYKDKSKAGKLDAIFERIQALLDKFTDEEPSQNVEVEDARQEKQVCDQAAPFQAAPFQAAQIAQFAAQAFVVAEQLGISRRKLDRFCLDSAQREVLRFLPCMPKTLKKRLALGGSTFSVGEVAIMTLALAEDLPNVDAGQQAAEIHLAKHLMEQLQSGMTAEAQTKRKRKPRRRSKATDALYQFRITLLGVEPPIWRRIQVQNCTLDKLHEYIQTAMGWTNSHLHEFEIKGRRYGDPALFDDGFDGIECEDSTTTMVSEILPKTGRRFAFRYEYDFGDSWEHEILFEGSPPVDPKAGYPLCLEGERACPPEDCGGAWGYGNFLDSIRNPKHKEHASMLEWVGGRFDPEEFNAKKATKEMKKGLPDWRAMDDGV